MTALAAMALVATYLLLDKHLPTLLHRDSGRRWRLPSFVPRLRSDP